MSDSDFKYWPPLEAHERRFVRHEKYYYRWTPEMDRPMYYNDGIWQPSVDFITLDGILKFSASSVRELDAFPPRASGQ